MPPSLSGACAGMIGVILLDSVTAVDMCVGIYEMPVVSPPAVAGKVGNGPPLSCIRSPLQQLLFGTIC